MNQKSYNLVFEYKKLFNIIQYIEIHIIKKSLNLHNLENLWSFKAEVLFSFQILEQE